MSLGDILKGIWGKPSDPGIIELLYRWYGQKVYHAAYYVLHDRNLAEDVTQETFLTAMSKLDTLRDPNKAEAWLARTAINKSYEVLREHRRMDVLKATVTASEGDSVLDHLLDDEIRKEVNEALCQIPTINQEVVYYRFYCELNCREISEIIGIPEGTVRSRLKRTLELVAGYLGREVSVANAAGK